MINKMKTKYKIMNIVLPFILLFQGLLSFIDHWFAKFTITCYTIGMVLIWYKDEIYDRVIKKI